jgi:hypothetical protein
MPPLSDHHEEFMMNIKVCSAAAAALAGASIALAGGTPEQAIIIADPASAESMYVANYYKQLRDVPDRNVIYMPPVPGNYAAFIMNSSW